MATVAALDAAAVVRRIAVTVAYRVGSHVERDASMKHFAIATVAEQSTDFRRVLWTGMHAQLVIMTIPPGGEIGEETHEDTDQILTFVSGTGEAVVADQNHLVTQGDLVAVPAGTRHNFRNTGVNPLVLYTVYGPPEHADSVVHATKEEADAAEISGRDADARDLDTSDKDPQRSVSTVQAQISPSESGSLGIGSLKGR
jgi:mannose-6-phosphate isomerase-like protein (cupin superfamily)